VARSEKDIARRSSFVKFGCEGDRRTNRKAIVSEVQFCKLASSGEVPTPRVLETLTGMDIDHAVASGGDKIDSFTYHVLVTEFHEDYVVRASGLVSYDLSLITAVKKLHAIGILHCDIKPDNIIWDPATKVVRLVDFGHTQTIEKAVSYQTTTKYQAPEVVNGKSPHSVSSDAFSIGQTILDEFNRLDEVGQVGHSTVDNGNVSALHSVREVALLLTQDSRVCYESHLTGRSRVSIAINCVASTWRKTMRRWIRCTIRQSLVRF
jgi:Protein kinase domain